jgi:hypothetical protein
MVPLTNQVLAAAGQPIAVQVFFKGHPHLPNAWQFFVPVPVLSAQQLIILLGESYPSGEKTPWRRLAVVADRCGQNKVTPWGAIRLRQSGCGQSRQLQKWGHPMLYANQSPPQFPVIFLSPTERPQAVERTLPLR